MELKKLEEILRLFESTTLQCMELEEEGIKLKLEKDRVPSMPLGSVPYPVASPVEIKPEAVEVATKEELKEVGTWVKAPLVGTIYTSRSESDGPFVCEQQAVKKGDIICIIEAMKVMNEIRAPFDGLVRKISMENDMMVEFDQPLILLEPSNV